MKTKFFLIACLVALPLLTITAVALARSDRSQSEGESATTLIQAVRQATEPYKNVEAAEAAGYGLFHGCVSGPQEGAMGVHLVNGDLVGDGMPDPHAAGETNSGLNPLAASDHRLSFSSAA